MRTRFVYLLEATAFTLAFAVAASAQGRGFALPRQGFESTAQNPANYTPQEAAAVAVVLKWVETTNSHDTPGHMALVGDNAAFRGDPLEPLRRGARGYCAAFGFVGSRAWFGLNELYVVGGPSDTLVLMKRTDINSPYNGGLLSGYPVPLAAFLRVQNGKVVEWYDMPTNKVSIAALPNRPALGGPQNIPERCRPFPEGGVAPAVVASGTVTLPPAITYGTNKPEFWFNPYEESAAQAVRAWFAARQAGNPLLLGAFVDPNVSFRATPSDDLGKGRDSLLRTVCGYIGGRLEVTELFVVGGDYDTAVMTRWNAYGADGIRIPMGSFFRVQNGRIVEWMDAALDGANPATTTDPNSAACRAVNTALVPPPALGPTGGRGGPPPGN